MIKRNANPIILSSFCHPGWFPFEGSRWESCYRSLEAVTSAVPWQLSGSPCVPEIFALQVLSCAALVGPQKAQARRNVAPNIKVTVLLNQCGHPAHIITWRARLSPSARCHRQPLTMKLCEGVSPDAIHVCSRRSGLTLRRRPSSSTPQGCFCSPGCFYRGLAVEDSRSKHGLPFPKLLANSAVSSLIKRKPGR